MKEYIRTMPDPTNGSISHIMKYENMPTERMFARPFEACLISFSIFPIATNTIEI